MNRFTLQIHGSIGTGYCVGRVTTSDYVSFSREYAKKDREPLTFTAENLDTSTINHYGRVFLRTHVTVPEDTNNAHTVTPRPLLRRAHALINAAADSATYNSIKSSVIEEFGSTAFEQQKHIIKFLLEHRQHFTTTVGLAYKTADGFIKICRREYFGGLGPDAFTFFILDLECLGYGEPMQEQTPCKILYVDKSNRNQWNLEHRFFLGGTGDGVNAMYMCSNPPTSSAVPSNDSLVMHFVVKDLDYKDHTQKKMRALSQDLDNKAQALLNAEELIQLLRENNGEAEHEVQQEHKRNETMKSQAVHSRMLHQEQLTEKIDEIKLIKKQKKLLILTQKMKVMKISAHHLVLYLKHFMN